MTLFVLIAFSSISKRVRVLLFVLLLQITYSTESNTQEPRDQTLT